MKGFIRDNRGSGIVIVMVAMLMLVALGTSLLFSSYTGFRLKVTERGSDENFYDAETCVSEVRDGIQRAVTESIATAYQQVLLEYNTSKDTEGDFRSKFESALFSWTPDEEKTHGSPTLLIRNDTVGLMSYDPAVLRSFISDDHAVLSCPSPTVTIVTEVVRDADGNALLDDEGKERSQSVSVTLNGIRVTYTDDAGYETSVSTDVTVTLPDFDYSLTEYSLTGVPEFAMVARESLTQTSNNVVLELTGNAYAGQMNLTQNGTTLTITGGTLICGGNVAVSGAGFGGRPHLVVDSNASIWANRISVGDTAAISLSGETYVADDLELAGNGASAALSGKYYGFGYLSDDELQAGAADAGRASSIVINGKNTDLDLSGLTDLVLAGNSFVDTGAAGFTGKDIVMGQSVSVRSDQLAYLLPKECVILGTGDAAATLSANPYSFSGSTAPTWTIDPAAVEACGLSDYVSVSNGVVKGVQPVYSNLSSAGTHILYFYIAFDSRADANAYFTKYFSTHSDSITNYLGLYSDTLASSRTTLTSGTAYDLSEDGSLTLLQSAGAASLSVSAAKYRERYENMCVTLSSRSKDSTPTPRDKAGNALVKNPFDYVVNRAGLPDETTYFYDDAGEPVGVIVVGGSCRVSDFPGSVRVIISTGSISVDNAFTGLLISDRTVTMNASLFSAPEQVTGALRGRNAAGDSLLSFLNVGDDEYTGSENKGGGATWDSYSLVSYSNWAKG